METSKIELLIQLVLRLHKQSNLTNTTNTTKTNQPQDTNNLIYIIRPNQMTNKQKGSWILLDLLDLNNTKTLNREYTTVEYLNTIRDNKLRNPMTQ